MVDYYVEASVEFNTEVYGYDPAEACSNVWATFDMAIDSFELTQTGACRMCNPPLHTTSAPTPALSDHDIVVPCPTRLVQCPCVWIAL